jgi:hypothetical protein
MNFKSSRENIVAVDIYSSGHYFIEGDDKTAQFNFRSVIFRSQTLYKSPQATGETRGLARAVHPQV